MRSPRQQLIVAFVVAFSVTSCGVSHRVSVIQPKHPKLGIESMKFKSESVNTQRAGDTAVLQQRRDVFIWADAAAREQPQAPPVEPSSTTTPQPVVSVASAPSPWPCVAEAETGSDWSMTGSTYSTAYGIINEIVREYASPDVQARVFAGTASEAEQTDIVVRFAADHGTGGWGELTKQKCGL